MADKAKAPPEAPNEERRSEFAPHHNPKQQGDGDPGPRSTTERANDERGAEGPESVEDDGTDD
jgi:hypothetical protein